MAILDIHQLKLATKIGVLPWEQQVKQTILLDIELDLNTEKARQSDDLDDTLDYRTLTESIRTYLEQHTYKLLESLAENLVDFIQQASQSSWVHLTIKKPQALAHTQYVAISVSRGHKPETHHTRQA